MIYYNTSALSNGLWLAEHPSTITFKKDGGWDNVHAISSEKLNNMSIRLDQSTRLLAKYMEIIKPIKCKTEKNSIMVSCIPKDLTDSNRLVEKIQEYCDFKIEVTAATFVVRTQNGYIGINPFKAITKYTSPEIQHQNIEDFKVKNLTRKIESEMVAIYRDLDGSAWCGFLPKWRIEHNIVYML